MIFIFFLVGALISTIAPIINFSYGVFFNVILLILAPVVYSYFAKQAFKKKNGIEKTIRKYKFQFFSFSIGIIAGLFFFVYYASYQIDHILAHAVAMGF